MKIGASFRRTVPGPMPIRATAFLCSLLCTLLAPPHISARSSEIQPFRILTPRTTGTGNTDLPFSRGMESLWSNPAGFSGDEWELTILGFDISCFGTARGLWNLRDSSLPDPENTARILSLLEPLITDRGAGMQAAAGISWAGRRVALGLFDSLGWYLQGSPYPAATAGYLDNTVTVPIGYAFPFPLGKRTVLSAGIILRPSLKQRLILGNADVAELSAPGGNQGSPADWILGRLGAVEPAFALPLDAGARLSLPGGFSGALTVRDLRAGYEDSSGTEVWSTPWSLNAGLGWHPDTGTARWFIDPSFAVEMSGINRIIPGKADILDEIHAGMELALLKRTILLWAGLDGGNPAFGAGLDLLALDLSMAWGTGDIDTGSGTEEATNLTVEVSFRID